MGRSGCESFKGVVAIEYRVELKYLVPDVMLQALSIRLNAVMRRDTHQKGSAYVVRSLYFDNAYDRCMDDNETGVDDRAKLRIRLYDANTDFIRFEIKEKHAGLTKKDACSITEDECRQLMHSKQMTNSGDRRSLNRLFSLQRSGLWTPKIIIEYARSAYVYSDGNVRITFDRNITASRFCDEFLSNNVPCRVPVLPTGMQILEVKYDAFMPGYIADLLELEGLQKTAFSKFYLGRLAVAGRFETRW